MLKTVQSTVDHHCISKPNPTLTLKLAKLNVHKRLISLFAKKELVMLSKNCTWKAYVMLDSSSIVWWNMENWRSKQIDLRIVVEISDGLCRVDKSRRDNYANNGEFVTWTAFTLVTLRNFALSMESYWWLSVIVKRLLKDFFNWARRLKNFLEIQF